MAGCVLRLFLAVSWVGLCSVTVSVNFLFSLLITFANSLNPDQARQNVRPDLEQNCLTL